MTSFLLVRHGKHDGPDDVLIGRSDSAGLSAEGREQIRRLGFFIARQKIDGIHSSPRRRCRETAEELALACRTTMETVDALDEIDFGAWAGRSFTDLQSDPLWNAWNAQRDVVRAPGGERMRDVQIRILSHLNCVAALRPEARIMIVTHAEVVRAAVLADRGIGLRDWTEIGVEPGSIWPIERPMASAEALAS